MLTHLNIRNFKGFKQQTLQFSKINVFVGPNNSGKLSALSAIDLLAQTALSSEYGANALILNGQFEQLGTFVDIVLGNRSNTSIGLSFSYGNRHDVILDSKHPSERREIELLIFELAHGGRPISSYNAKTDGYETLIAGQLDAHPKQASREIQRERADVELLGFWSFDSRIRTTQLPNATENDTIQSILLRLDLN